jgi:hypothetical protein
VGYINNSGELVYSVSTSDFNTASVGGVKTLAYGTVNAGGTGGGGGTPQTNTNPTAPTSHSVTTLLQTSARVQFAGYTDAEDVVADLKFNVYLNGSLVGSNVTSGGATTTYLFSNLTAGTEYDFDIETVDTGGLVSVAQYSSTFTTQTGGGQ